MNRSDKEHRLVEDMVSGQSVDEDALMMFLRPMVFISVCRSLGANNADIEDLCNDILLAILEKVRAGQYDPGKGRLKNYAGGITRNKIVGYFRMDHRKPHTPGNLPVTPVAATVEKSLEAEERRALIERNLKRMPEKYRQVLRLRFYEEMSISEIAAAIDLPNRRVSERINYALKLLRKKLGAKHLLSIFRGLMLIIE